MTILGITGHRDMPVPAARYVANALDELVRTAAQPLTGVSSLAAGADQLFAVAVLRHSGRLKVVLPCQGYDSTFKDPASMAAFRELLERVLPSDVETLPYLSPSDDAFMAAGRRIADLCDVLVAVWDGAKARGKGGTGDVVRYARARGREVLRVWPSGVTRDPV